MVRREMVLDYAINGRAASVRDALARARWILDESSYTSLTGLDRDIGHATVLDDFERMGERVGNLTRENQRLRTKRAVSEGHPDRRTNAEKRAAVETVLQTEADTLSLRQIAEATRVRYETARKVRASWTPSKIDGDAVRLE